MSRLDAESRLREIAESREIIRRESRKIGTHLGALARAVEKPFDEESAELDGMLFDPKWAVIGYESCAESPIGVCIYNERVISLPGQRLHAGERLPKPNDPPNFSPYACHAECRTDACLFCGKLMVENAEWDRRQLLAPRAKNGKSK